jgi:hypothetical protein
MDGSRQLDMGQELVQRLEAAATLMERTLGWLDERHQALSSAVERITATVESTQREEALLAKLEEVERELAQLRAAAGQNATAQKVSAGAGDGFPKALLPMRRTLPTATAEMLSKQGFGDGVVDVRSLDAALVGLSLEQRIAVKSQLRRAGAVA